MLQPPKLPLEMPLYVYHNLFLMLEILIQKKEVVTNYFGKLDSLYGRLNLIAKPMQVFNAEKTGAILVHKPGKVVAMQGREHVYSDTSAERGCTHTVLSCISATSFLLDVDVDTTVGDVCGTIGSDIGVSELS